MKLLQTKDYLLLVEKVNEFKVGDWNYEEDNTIPVYQFGYIIDEYPGNKIIAYHPLTKEAKELDLPLLPPFEENIEILWSDFNKNHNRNCPLSKEQFVRAINYKTAQSKQFSLEDILNFRKVLEEGALTNMSCASAIVEFDKFIQSLSTQQLPKEFIPEYETPYSDGFTHDRVRRFYGKPVLKTTTNSEGKEELVGTYKY